MATLPLVLYLIAWYLANNPALEGSSIYEKKLIWNYANSRDNGRVFFKPNDNSDTSDQWMQTHLTNLILQNHLTLGIHFSNLTHLTIMTHMTPLNHLILTLTIRPKWLIWLSPFPYHTIIFNWQKNNLPSTSLRWAQLVNHIDCWTHFH